MTEFFWTPTPREGLCVVCGTATLDAGFVDMVGDTIAFSREGMEHNVVVDMIVCARCIRQAATKVGCADPGQVEEFAYREKQLEEENQKLKDEIQAWQERFLAMVNLQASDFDKLADAFNAANPDPAPST